MKFGIMTLAFFVLTQYRRVSDRRIDGRTRCDRYYPRYHSVARIKRVKSKQNCYNAEKVGYSVLSFIALSRRRVDIKL